MDNFEAEKRRLQATLMGPDWREVLAPRIKKQLNRALAKLIAGEAEGERLRGWIAALTWVLEAPWKELEEYDQRISSEREDQAMEEAIEQILAHGFRASPIDEET